MCPGYCDPLSGKNSFGLVRPMVKGEKYVMAAAAADSMALVHDVAYGSDSDASGGGQGKQCSLHACYLRAACSPQRLYFIFITLVLIMLFCSEWDV